MLGIVVVVFVQLWWIRNTLKFYDPCRQTHARDFTFEIMFTSIGWRSKNTLGSVPIIITNSPCINAFCFYFYIIIRFNFLWRIFHHHNWTCNELLTLMTWCDLWTVFPLHFVITRLSLSVNLHTFNWFANLSALVFRYFFHSIEIKQSFNESSVFFSSYSVGIC